MKIIHSEPVWVPDPPPKILLLVMTDGRRQYIHRTLASAAKNLKGPIEAKFIYDDSGDANNHEWLSSEFPDFHIIYQPTRQGFGGAIDSAWNRIKQYEFDYVFHLEDDFTFNREVPLENMAQVLADNPHVYQMALRRQPWNAEEAAAGGVIQRWPNNFKQEDGWISHRMFFTSNPCLYRKSLIETRTYPRVKDSEGHFSHSIYSNEPDALFGFWGLKTEEPWVTHIGEMRGGGFY